MVAPVTGPINKSDSSRLWSYYYNSSRYKQRRPYNLVLPYFVQSSRVLPNAILPNPTYAVANKAFAANTLGSSTEVAQAQAKAYERLKGKIGDRASMGENLGQLGESVRLIVDKARLVKEAVTRLRRFDVSAFAEWMDRGFVKRNSRFAAQLTLEINFAIKPSVDDIYTAIEILQNPVPDQLVKARASSTYERTYRNPNPGTVNQIWTAKASAEYGALFAVANRNLYLANALGMINPVQVVWQLLPGSFLADWFIPVEQFLGQATDFYGLTLTDSYSTYFVRGDYFEWWTPYSGLPETAYRMKVPFAEVKRVQGISLPPLTFRPLKTPSLKRAANAVSLAIQAFYK